MEALVDALALLKTPNSAPESRTSSQEVAVAVLTVTWRLRSSVPKSPTPGGSACAKLILSRLSGVIVLATEEMLTGVVVVGIANFGVGAFRCRLSYGNSRLGAFLRRLSFAHLAALSAE